MHPDLELRFERLEQRRFELVASLSGRDEAWLNRPPRPGSWSLVQVVEHLVLSEAGTLGYLAKKLQTPPEALPETGLGAALRSLALSFTLRSPYRARAPERVHPVAESQPLEPLSERWNEVRKGWRERLESFPEALQRKAVFRHPFAGRLNMRQTLRFMNDHLVHHAAQIERGRRLLG